MRENESQSDGVPASVLGVQIEGPSSEGFRFYPVLHGKAAEGYPAKSVSFRRIHPDGKSHDWSLNYDPNGAGGNGQVVVTLDGKSGTFDLRNADKTRGSGRSTVSAS